MAMTQYTGDTEIITNIGTTPQERGLSTDEFKAKFDEGLKAFVTWFNDTHKTEFDAHLEDLVTDEGGVHGLEVEGGMWTPELKGLGVPGTFTYAIQIGKYYKVGKRVFIHAKIRITSWSGATGNLDVLGLPFASNDNYAVYFDRHAGITFGAGFTYLSGYTNTNELRIMQNGSAKEATLLPVSALGQNADIFIACTYLID